MFTIGDSYEPSSFPTITGKEDNPNVSPFITNGAHCCMREASGLLLSSASRSAVVASGRCDGHVMVMWMFPKMVVPPNHPF